MQLPHAPADLMRSKRAHIRRDTRDAQQTRLRVDQRLNCRCIHSFLLHEIQQDPRVERASASPHHQAIDCRKAHGTRNALAICNGTQASSISQVRQDEVL